MQFAWIKSMKTKARGTMIRFPLKNTTNQHKFNTKINGLSRHLWKRLTGRSLFNCPPLKDNFFGVFEWVKSIKSRNFWLQKEIFRGDAKIQW